MKLILKNKKKIFNQIVQTLKKHNAIEIAVFGSFAREDENQKSDIDIIVKFLGRKSLLDIVGIEQELSEKIGRKIDLLTEKSISPYLIDRIKREIKIIYP